MYQPLNHHLREIRLLSIQPGKKDSRIEIKLSTHTLPSYVPDRSEKGQSTAPAYDALSYEWGDPNGAKHNILLDGQPLEVRDNLFHALKMLRAFPAEYQKLPNQKPPALFDETRLLWIDAICINQKDIQERNHQVRMMSHIYKWAWYVRVWLGGWTKGDTEAFELMREITQALRRRPKRLESLGIIKLFRPPIVDQTRLYVKNLQSAWAKVYAADNKPRGIWNFGGWGALASILERSYWTRIWIVQEYLLAQDLTIHFGNYWIEDDDMKDVLETIDTIDQLQPRISADLQVSIIQTVDRINNSVGKKINEMRRDKQRLSLLELMETTRNSHCQAAHDRIYAILGLATDSATFNSIPIDYDRSPFKVKMDIAWAVLQRHGNGVYLSRIIALVCEAFSGVPDEPD
jgi:hypothetical protein